MIKSASIIMLFKRARSKADNCLTLLVATPITCSVATVLDIDNYIKHLECELNNARAEISELKNEVV